MVGWQDEGCWGGGDGRGWWGGGGRGGRDGGDGGAVGGESVTVTPQLVTAFTS